MSIIDGDGNGDGEKRSIEEKRALLALYEKSGSYSADVHGTRTEVWDLLTSSYDMLSPSRNRNIIIEQRE